jgi:hypothetical protein
MARKTKPTSTKTSDNSPAQAIRYPNEDLLTQTRATVRDEHEWRTTTGGVSLSPTSRWLSAVVESMKAADSLFRDVQWIGGGVDASPASESAMLYSAGETVCRKIAGLDEWLSIAHRTHLELDERAFLRLWSRSATVSLGGRGGFAPMAATLFSFATHENFLKSLMDAQPKGWIDDRREDFESLALGSMQDPLGPMFRSVSDSALCRCFRSLATHELPIRIYQRGIETSASTRPTRAEVDTVAAEVWRVEAMLRLEDAPADTGTRRLPFGPMANVSDGGSDVRKSPYWFEAVTANHKGAVLKAGTIRKAKSEGRLSGSAGDGTVSVSEVCATWTDSAIVIESALQKEHGKKL